MLPQLPKPTTPVTVPKSPKDFVPLLADGTGKRISILHFVDDPNFWHCASPPERFTAGLQFSKNCLHCINDLQQKIPQFLPTAESVFEIVNWIDGHDSEYFTLSP
jgi:hypothetical protein